METRETKLFMLQIGSSSVKRLNLLESLAFLFLFFIDSKQLENALEIPYERQDKQNTFEENPRSLQVLLPKSPLYLLSSLPNLSTAMGSFYFKRRKS